MSTLPPAAQAHGREAVVFNDALSGRPVLRLTSAAAISHHIYPEAMTFTPDGNQVLFWRARGQDWYSDIFLADLQSRTIRALTDEAKRGEGACYGPTVSPDGEAVYYMVFDPPQVELRRVSLKTFERQRLMTLPAARRLYVLGTLSPDGRHYVTGLTPPEGDPQVLRVDLDTGEQEVIYSSPDVFNPHPVWDPSGADWVLVQENTDYQLTERGSRMTGGLGARLIVMRPDGSDVRELDVGRRKTEWIQGHQTWRGESGEVVATVVRQRTGAGPRRSDVILGLTPDGGRRVVAAGHSFWHIGSDASGKWLSSDMTGTGLLYIVDAETGACKFVCASESSCGAPQYTHPHPALSPDARWLVFNSDRTGLAQLYATNIADLTGA
ncbi:MAG: PD40 domain-containing protein [Armatimonadetes bacterium]|nr:PD40 domain-containing protein [Armatimonadota bacterium]